MEVERECYDDNSVTQLELFYKIHAIKAQFATVLIDDLSDRLIHSTVELILQNLINYETALIAIFKLRRKPASRTRITFLDALLCSTCNHRHTCYFKYFSKEHARVAIGASTNFIKTAEINGAIRLPIPEEDTSDASTEFSDSESSERSSQNQGSSDGDKENKMPVALMNGSQSTEPWRGLMLDPGINPAQRTALSSVYRSLSPPDLSDEDEPAPAIPHTPTHDRDEVMIYEDGAEFGPFQILASNKPTPCTQLVPVIFQVVSLRALPSADIDSIAIGWVVIDPDITLDHVDHVLVTFTGRPGKYAMVSKEDFQMDDAGALERMTPEELFLGGKREHLLDKSMECSTLPKRIVEKTAREAEEDIMLERTEME